MLGGVRFHDRGDTLVEQIQHHVGHKLVLLGIEAYAAQRGVQIRKGWDMERRSERLTETFTALADDGSGESITIHVFTTIITVGFVDGSSNSARGSSRYVTASGDHVNVEGDSLVVVRTGRRFRRA